MSPRFDENQWRHDLAKRRAARGPRWKLSRHYPRLRHYHRWDALPTLKFALIVALALVCVKVAVGLLAAV